MTDLTEIERRIDTLFVSPPYAAEPSLRLSNLLALLQDELEYAAARNPHFRNYLDNWPVDYHTAEAIADLPFLPVGAFKANPPLTLINTDEIKRILSSSATTGQVPSRVFLDNATARRMTKGIITIIRDFIGSARRPFLVIDTSDKLSGEAELGARGAAIQGLIPFATETVCCLNGDTVTAPSLDLRKLMDCGQKWKQADVIVYGFTYVIWNYFVKPLESAGMKLDMPNVRVLHSGGWKRLEAQAVTKDMFAARVASVFGCSPKDVIDFYGMVENVGVVYPDCPYSNKHAPTFAEVIIRNPLTLQPVDVGEQGLVQVCSALPTSFTGFLVLTEDIGEVVDYDNCPCGRRGICFHFVKRVPKAELRGCGNMDVSRR
ncbi:MAG: acyl-protein synthetase [Acidobacteriia bacterium]|nr:acyl-protein synthetase [Terriglobia bacterium]